MRNNEKDLTKSNRLYTRMKTAERVEDFKEADRLYPLYCEQYRTDTGEESYAAMCARVDREANRPSVRGY